MTDVKAIEKLEKKLEKLEEKFDEILDSISEGEKLRDIYSEINEVREELSIIRS